MNLNSNPVFRSSDDCSGWIDQIRSLPSRLCPDREGLELFAVQPLAVEGSSYAHIVQGCDECRAQLQRLLLRAS